MHQGWSYGLPPVVKNRTIPERSRGRSTRAGAPGPEHQAWFSSPGAPGLELRPASCSKESDHFRTEPGPERQGGGARAGAPGLVSSLGAPGLELRPASCRKGSDHVNPVPGLEHQGGSTKAGAPALALLPRPKNHRTDDGPNKSLRYYKLLCKSVFFLGSGTSPPHAGISGGFIS